MRKKKKKNIFARIFTAQQQKVKRRLKMCFFFSCRHPDRKKTNIRNSSWKFLKNENNNNRDSGEKHMRNGLLLLLGYCTWATDSVQMIYNAAAVDG